MPAQWTGELIGKMHIHGITAIELAERLGYNPKYLSAILNGRVSPKDAQMRCTEALEALLVERGV